MKQPVNVEVEIDEVEAKLLGAMGELRGMNLKQVVGEAVVTYVQNRLRLWCPRDDGSDLTQ